MLRIRKVHWVIAAIIDIIIISLIVLYLTSCSTIIPCNTVYEVHLDSSAWPGETLLHRTESYEDAQEYVKTYMEFHKDLEIRVINNDL
jgi:hypothetical protein